ncbi:MAG: hypothetical protein ACR2J8_11350 [Thermomicrobiales bacterium]
MSATRQFFKQHYDLLENPEYRTRFFSPQYVVYLWMYRKIYRWQPGWTTDHPMYGFWKEGWLAARVDVRDLRDLWGTSRSARSIERDLVDLDELGMIDIYDDPDSRHHRVVRFGSWTEIVHNDRRNTRQIAEITYADRVFGPFVLPDDDEA